MTYDSDFFRTFVLGAAAVGQTLFVALYATFPWHKTFLGRTLFGNALMLAVIMDTFIVTRLLGVGTNDALFIFLYFLLTLSIWAELIVFLMIRWRERKSVSGNGAR